MSRSRIALSVALLFALVIVPRVSRAAEHNRLSTDELAAGWILLFDGESLYGWEPSSKADWQVDQGTIKVATGESGLLCTTSEFADYQLRVDFRAPKTTNSGVFLRTVTKPKDPAADCYELNIADTSVSPFPTGSFVKRQKASDYQASDEWQSFDVTANGGHFVIKLDGKTVLDYTDPAPTRRGRIGLQLNSGGVEFRNIKLRPLGTKDLFNGKDLAGWSVYPDLKSVFSVNDKGELNVKDGRGQLETSQRFADFVLQLEVFSNGKHLNSGMFFRSIPGDLMNGYEMQIHNGYKEGNRNEPLDYGSGAFYRRQVARRVVSNDFEWTPMTLVVSGLHMAAWVNGVQVSDWTDDRAADLNPRKGARREPGTFIIQGHDPTTDLTFRKIRAVEMKP